MNILEIQSNDDILNIVNMADIIWNDAYKNILSKEQINYMLNKFLSLNAINENINNGYKYYLLNDNGKNLGFMGCIFHKEYIFLSKLYILPKYQNKKYSTFAINYLKSFNLPIELTVNKYNTNAINKYIHFGFKIIDSVITDIGNNYVMDDYIMRNKPTLK